MNVQCISTFQQNFYNTSKNLLMKLKTINNLKKILILLNNWNIHSILNKISKNSHIKILKAFIKGKSSNLNVSDRDKQKQFILSIKKICRILYADNLNVYIKNISDRFVKIDLLIISFDSQPI